MTDAHFNARLSVLYEHRFSHSGNVFNIDDQIPKAQMAVDKVNF